MWKTRSRGIFLCKTGDFQVQPGSQVLFFVAGSGEIRWKNLVGEGKMDNNGQT